MSFKPQKVLWNRYKSIRSNFHKNKSECGTINWCCRCYLSVPGLYTATVAMLLASATMREKRAVLIMATGVALNVALNLVAIPQYGALGAAWVTVISQTFVAVWLVGDAYRTVARHPRMALEPERQLETAIALRDD